MEYMEGGTLHEAVKGHNFSEPEMAFVGREMMLGIKYVHDLSLAHRDLKSQNVMLTVQGDVKLIDFGLAVDVSKGDRSHMVGRFVLFPYSARFIYKTVYLSCYLLFRFSFWIIVLQSFLDATGDDSRKATFIAC